MRRYASRDGIVRDRAFVFCVLLVAALTCAVIFSSQARAADLVVTSNADSGAGTLREALVTANGNSEADTITFDLPQGERTITLTGGQLQATTGTTTIDGVDQITVDGNDTSRILEVTGGNLTLRGLTLTNGNANASIGGAISSDSDSTLTLTDTTISENNADFGGGIYNDGGTLTVESSIISNNSAGFSGGIENYGTVKVTDSTIRGNRATDGGGGAILNFETLTATDSTISNNSAVSGGAIENIGTLTVTDTTVSQNSARGSGGGINHTGGELTVEGSTISVNSASSGGGIENYGTATVTGTTISNNNAEFVGGGGIYNGNELTVTDTTISDNSATDGAEGGGIYTTTQGYSPDTTPPQSRTTITNSTISGNSSDGSGSGVRNNNGYTEINYSTIADNSSTDASAEGVESYGDETTGTRLTASIVAGNTSNGQPRDVGNFFSDERPYESGGYNVIGQSDRASDFTASGDTTGRTVEQAFGTANPTLADNGGLTQTIALGSASDAGSDAVNRIPSGTDGVPPNDQRGVERPQGRGSESGSYEAEFDPAPTIAIAPASLPNATEDTAYSQTLSASGGTAPYAYSIIGGSFPPGLTLSSNGTISGTPTQAGTYNFTVTATDDDGFNGSRAYTVTVAEASDAPVVSTSGGATAFTEDGSPVAVDDALTVSDQDSTTLASATVSITGNFQSQQDVLAFTNDGVSQGNVRGSYNSATGVLTLTSPGASATLSQWQSALRNVTYDNTSDAPNTSNRTVSFRVNDGTDDSNTATKAISVTAVNDAPVANDDDATVAEDGENATFDLRSLVTDPETSDADIEYEVTEGPTPAQGTALISDDGVLTFDPANDFNGTVEITYTATDEGDLSDTGTLTVTVTPVNDAPVARDDRFTTDEDTPLTLTQAQIVANDDNGDGGERGAGLTITGVSNPANGEAILNEDGTVTFTPDANYNGDGASFRYEVTDGQGNTSVAVANVEVRVNAVNDAPAVTTSPGSASYTEGAPPVVVDPQLTVTDADDTTLAAGSVSVLTGFDPDDELTFTPGQDTGNIQGSYDEGAGILLLESEGATATVAEWQAALRSVTFSNDSDDFVAGTRTVSFEVVDDGGAESDSATKDISATSVNDAPMAEDDELTVDEDSDPTIVPVLANDTDADGDALSISEVTQPENGTVTLEDGVLRYRPAADFNGTDTFTYTASDGTDESEEATVTIEVGASDDSPTITEVEDQRIRENSATERLGFTVTDPDNEASSLEVNAASSNTQLVKRDGIKLSGSGEERTVRIVPEKNRTGSARITLTVTDSSGLTDTESFVVRVTAAQEPEPEPDGRCTITGTNGSDLLRGTAGKDVICGLGGNDRLVGRGGGDILRGGGGSDSLEGNNGDDELYGGAGNDRLEGGAGRDKLDGGSGRNVLKQ